MKELCCFTKELQVREQGIDTSNKGYSSGRRKGNTDMDRWMDG